MHDGERDFPDWVLAVASAVGLLFASPFAYFMVVEWLELVSLSGWFSYVMMGWAGLCVGALAFHVIGEQLERWHYIRKGREVIHRSDTSEPDS